MWPTLHLSVTAAVIVAASLLLVALASTCALARAQVERLDADLASVIRADYSADPRGVTLAPLTQGIVDVARRDESRLQATIPGIEIVPVSHQPASTVAEDGAEPATPDTPTASPSQAPPTPQSNPGGPAPPPTSGISPGWPPPGLPPTQPPGTPPPASPIATPLPTSAPTSPPTSAASPSATLTSTPTLTPVPTLSPAGTPSATATRMHDR